MNDHDDQNNQDLRHLSFLRTQILRTSSIIIIGMRMARMGNGDNAELAFIVWVRPLFLQRADDW